MDGNMTFRTIAILVLIPTLTIGCAKPRPHAHLVAPPECVQILSSVPLTDDGKAILPKAHFDMRINCTKVVQPFDPR